MNIPNRESAISRVVVRSNQLDHKRQDDKERTLSAVDGVPTPHSSLPTAGPSRVGAQVARASQMARASDAKMNK